MTIHTYKVIYKNIKTDKTREIYIDAKESHLIAWVETTQEAAQKLLKMSKEWYLSSIELMR